MKNPADNQLLQQQIQKAIQEAYNWNQQQSQMAQNNFEYEPRFKDYTFFLKK